jgi:type III secretion protein C
LALGRGLHVFRSPLLFLSEHRRLARFGTPVLAALHFEVALSAWATPRRAARMAALAIALLAATGPQAASAQEIPWHKQHFDLRAQNEPLSVFLGRILTLNGIASSVSPPVATAKVNGRLHGSGDTIFRELADTYGLTWYFDGSMLYVYSLSEIESRMLQVNPVDVMRVERTLKDMGLADSRFPLKVSPTEGQVLVSGPPRYVQIVGSIAARIANSPSLSMGQVDTHVFRLRYARAADTIVNIAGSETTIPGIARILNETLGPSASFVDTREPSRSLPVTVPGLRGKGQISIGSSNNNGSSTAARTSSTATPSSASSFDSAMPSELDGAHSSADGGGHPAREVAPPAGPLNPFTGAVARADPRINAVIIRDTQDRMPMYTRLIAELDVGTPLLEIEATVIDVSYDKSEQLGIDWRLHGQRADIVSSPNGLAGTGLGTTVNSANDLLYSAPPVSSGTGLIGTLLFGSDRTNFLARLNALTEKGDANLISKPRVLTLDNTEAVVQTTQDFYVRVAGRDQVDLFNVSLGLVLRVTPTLIDDAHGPQVKLNIRIEDGNTDSGALVDQIPVVNRNAISTQAVVANGMSLLIGGYSIDEKTHSNSGVPFLSDVPGLRWLFGQQANTSKRMERMFMITPRLVQPQEAGTAAADTAIRLGSFSTETGAVDSTASGALR